MNGDALLDLVGSGDLAAVGGASSRINPAALLAGLLCFAIVLAAIGYGIYIIVEK